MEPEAFYDDPEELAEATDRSKMPQAFLNVRETFANQFESGDRILDAGCGPGHDLEYFEQNGLDAIGVDISEENVEYVEDRGLEAENYDMKDMDFPDNYFDGIWCCASIHFNSPDKMYDAAEELYRVTEEAGKAHITFKLGEEPFYDQREGEKSVRHYLVSEDEAREVVENAGYEIIEDLTAVNNPGREEFNYFMNVFARKPEE